MAAKPRTMSLKEFLSRQNLPGALNLPWVHSASASRLFKIVEDEKLVAMNCTVFRGEKLCYFFVGRPAYKFNSEGVPSAWQLPVAFVLRFQSPPPIKRAFPFDSGAFMKNRMPDYISMFDLDGFDLAGDPQLVGRLVSLYFKTPERYVQRRAVGEEELKADNSFDMRHAELQALGRLFREGSTSNLDDRAAAVEIQVAQDVPLRREDLLGVVIPEEYARTPGVMKSLKALTKYVETYDLYPVSTNHHFALIYDRVNAIYKRSGIKI
jgi:hypothetical protein